MSLFSESSYATMYGSPAEIPDRMVRHNCACVKNVLDHPERFPRADWKACAADYEFLRFECTARGLVPAFGFEETRQ